MTQREYELQAVKLAMERIRHLDDEIEHILDDFAETLGVIIDYLDDYDLDTAARAAAAARKVVKRNLTRYRTQRVTSDAWIQMKHGENPDA